MAGADAAAFVLWPPAGQLATTWPGFSPGLPGHSKGTGQGHSVPPLQVWSSSLPLFPP